MSYDVVVVGGGPGGCATALALAQRGVSRVLVVEASDYRADRVGESVPPDIRGRLVSLGVWEEFAAQGHDVCLGSASSWGGDEVGFNDFVVSPHGPGWHLDRRRFDAGLAATVEARGIELRRRCRVIGVERGPQGLMQVGLQDEGGARIVATKFIVDASGRGAHVARKLGARRHMQDRLVCVAGFFQLPEGVDWHRLTMLEAVPYGWWYAAKLPDGRCTAAVASDPGTIRWLRASSSEGWQALLARTSHVGPELRRARFEQDSLRAWPAWSAVLDPPAGRGWAAVGDAASCFDPLSAQGVFKALGHALSVAPAIVAWLEGDARGLEDYRRSVVEDFVGYLRARDHLYGLEQRWPDSPFWQRRRAA